MVNYVSDPLHCLPSPTTRPHHVGVSIQGVPVAEGVLDPVLGEDGQPTPDHSAGGRGTGREGTRDRTSISPPVNQL